MSTENPTPQAVDLIGLVRGQKVRRRSGLISMYEYTIHGRCYFSDIAATVDYRTGRVYDSIPSVMDVIEVIQETSE